MPTYEYTARDREGNVSTGILIADDENQLRQTLRLRELFVTTYGVRSDRAVHQQKNVFLKPRRVKLQDLVVASRQLATLVRAGVPVIECLDSVALQTENTTLAEALWAVRLDVIAGDSMAISMRRHPRIFSELYCSLVEAGETGGMLEHTLEVAAGQFDKQATLREQVRSAMTYPVLVVFASVCVVAFMLMFIVPIFARIYAQFNADLPVITKFLVALSAFLVKWWFPTALVVIAIVLLVRQWYQTDSGRHAIDSFKLKIPLVGKLLHKIAVAQFTNTWAGTTKGGIPIITALQVSGRTSGNVIVQDAVLKVAADVQTGTALSTSLEEAKVFPPLVTRMVASGEKSGNLDEMLDELTHFYERDVEYGVQRLTRMMEPAMTVVVGGIVLFVLLALYMPVFTLAKVIKK